MNNGLFTVQHTGNLTMMYTLGPDVKVETTDGRTSLIFEHHYGTMGIVMDSNELAALAGILGRHLGLVEGHRA